MSAGPFMLFAYELPKEIRVLIDVPNKNFNAVLKIYNLLKQTKMFRRLYFGYIINDIPTFIKYHVMNKIIKKCNAANCGMFINVYGTPFCPYDILYKTIGGYKYNNMIKTVVDCGINRDVYRANPINMRPNISLFKLLIRKDKHIGATTLISLIDEYSNHYLMIKILKHYITKYRGSDSWYGHTETTYAGWSSIIMKNKCMVIIFYDNKYDVNRIISVMASPTSHDTLCIIDSKRYTKEKLRYILTTQILRKITTKNLTKLISYYSVSVLKAQQ